MSHVISIKLFLTALILTIKQVVSLIPQNLYKEYFQIGEKSLYIELLTSLNILKVKLHVLTFQEKNYMI